MARLTERNESGGIIVKDLSAALEKLAELEDADQNGRLVRVPVEAGRTVYWITDGTVKPFKVNYYLFSVNLFMNLAERDSCSYMENTSRIGKDVFLTREEAEAALKELVE